MKILVGVKRVVDANVKVRVKSDNTGVDLANAKMAINPFCEIAIEEAIRMKEAGAAEEVVAVSIGPSVCQEQIRTALALGSDRGILVETEDHVDPLAVAKILKAIIDKEQELVTEELKNSGKPEDIAKKISLGKMNKFKEENALLTQAWVMEPKKKVKDVLKELSIADLKIKEFYRIKIGE